MEKNSKVLLVDDYQANVLVASTFLESLGYDYDVAHDGVEALKKIEEGDYAAVLMDIQMPGMNGMEITRRIRAIEAEKEGCRMRIIAMTAHSLVGDGERFLSPGMDDCISKPFSANELKSKLEKHLADYQLNQGKRKVS